MDSTQNNTPIKTNHLGIPEETALQIGMRLKQERLQQGKNIPDIAFKTKIREQYLTAIEAGSWENLPPGLNGRGLIRNYARELVVAIPELEPQAIREFIQYFEQPHPQTLSQTKAEEIRHKEKSSALPHQPVRQRNPVQTHVPKVNNSPEIQTPDLESIVGFKLSDLPSDPYSKNNDKNAKNVLKEDPNVPRVTVDSVLSQYVSQSEDIKPVKISKKEVAEEIVTAKPIEEQKPVLEPIVPKETERIPASFLMKKEREEEVVVTPELKEEKIVAAAPAMPEPQAPLFIQPQQDKISVFQDLKLDDSIANPVVLKPQETDLREKLPGMPYHTPTSKLKPVAAFAFGLTVVAFAVGTYNWSRQNNLIRPSIDKLEEVTQKPAEVAPISPEINADLPQENLEAQLGLPDDGEQNLTANSPDTNIEPSETLNSAPQVAVKEPAVETPQVTNTTVQTSSQVQLSAQPPAPKPEAGQEAIGGLKTAVLQLSADVEIKVTSDGKVVQQGVKGPGEVKVSFQKQAEIYVKDGSKVSLSYGGWNHGALGSEGRKRRIILKGQTYSAN